MTKSDYRCFIVYGFYSLCDSIWKNYTNMYVVDVKYLNFIIYK